MTEPRWCSFSPGRIAVRCVALCCSFGGAEPSGAPHATHALQMTHWLFLTSRRHAGFGVMLATALPFSMFSSSFFLSGSCMHTHTHSLHLFFHLLSSFCSTQYTSFLYPSFIFFLSLFLYLSFFVKCTNSLSLLWVLCSVRDCTDDECKVE